MNRFVTSALFATLVVSVAFGCGAQQRWVCVRRRTRAPLALALALYTAVSRSDSLP